MHPDRARWNEKYAAARPGRANPRLIEEVSSLPPGLACDISMGVGHNARWLCEAGWRVLGVEISDLALMQAQRHLERFPETSMLVQADATHVALRPGTFDLVVCTYYLERRIVPFICSLPRPGGRIFFETYDSNHLRYVPDFPEEYCLINGEGARLFSGFEIRQKHIDSGHASIQSIVAKRP
jgi:2-polyprenyl-3-methyl-5-hydroxy-6-metoxy-1,4-benzoquinol methylase